MGKHMRFEDFAGVDNLVLSGLLPSMATANELLDQFISGQLAPDIAMAGFGNGFFEDRQSGAGLTAPRNVARVVFEDTHSISNSDALSNFDAILTGSEWNASLLVGTKRSVEVIHEGVDPTLFFPGPRSSLVAKHIFYVFSGGKLEYRKGQDIVLKVFARFSEKHPEARLVVNWQSLWPALSLKSINENLENPVQLDNYGRLDLKRWASAFGVRPDKIIDIGVVPNF
jgi:glycosyltransferase involved in cell wall biosynthesis